LAALLTAKSAPAEVTDNGFGLAMGASNDGAMFADS
jgi:hypothetical protein